MRRRLMAGLMASVLIVMAAIPAGASHQISFRGYVTDVAEAADAMDGVRAVATAHQGNGHTVARLNVRDIDQSLAGNAFGAHVHVGPCVAGDGAAALGHYNNGGDPSHRTEVWLDFTVTGQGTGHATAVVPFLIPAGGAASVVIHEMATAPSGAAGARLACLPLGF
ncbi:MAG: superoxide dismutase family protein [Acidimicrobiia bacterium]|nr:superoxide dismutase family protein [Acidimicrobiia bacterium]